MTLTNILQPIDDVPSATIIGVGAIGSNIAVQLVRLGIKKLVIWDDDYVAPHNITNQAYSEKHIGQLKVEALADILLDINPELSLVTFTRRYEGEPSRIPTHLFLAVDNIDTRNNIIDRLRTNRNVLSVCDFRLGTTSAQHYMVPWNAKEYKWLKDTMQFTQEEARENVPVSPCGTRMSVLPTVLTIVSYGIENWIKLVRSEPDIHKMIMVDINHCSLTTI